jgi:hypothetical protein
MIRCTPLVWNKVWKSSASSKPTKFSAKCFCYPNLDILLPNTEDKNTEIFRNVVVFDFWKTNHIFLYFAGSTQNHKKIIETPNQPIETKKISNKRMFSTSKVKRSQKRVWGLPEGICRLELKSLKYYWNIKSTNQTENFSQKKLYLAPQKCEGAKNSYTQRNLQARPKILKKIIETSILPIKTNIFSKKSLFSILKVSRSQKFVWGLPDGIRPGALKTIELKLSSENLNLKRRSV